MRPLFGFKNNNNNNNGNSSQSIFSCPFTIPHDGFWSEDP